MPVFEYRGLNEAGKTLTGLRDADSPKTLRTNLRREGIFLTEVLGEKGQAEQANGASKRVNLMALTERITAEDISILTRQLAVLIGAGVTLIEALTALIDQVEK